MNKEEKKKYLKSVVKVVRDYPKKGVNFKDLSSLLVDPVAYRYAIDLMPDANLVVRGYGLGAVLILFALALGSWNRSIFLFLSLRRTRGE